MSLVVVAAAAIVIVLLLLLFVAVVVVACAAFVGRTLRQYLQASRCRCCCCRCCLHNLYTASELHMFLSKLFSWPRHVLHGRPHARRTSHVACSSMAPPHGALQVNHFGHKFWRLACDTLFDIIEPERGYGQTKMEATATATAKWLGGQKAQKPTS